ncbi:SDR family NAD(P)-dependent oxidoreductase [Micromonospora sp. NPDC048170]|uniref:SDR family NAD(P)-dependent oxidoreductase n=1 Tax=Micromonospora sp. NPDC048170 TaxID=3154819 RepID=UPI0033F6AAE3
MSYFTDKVAVITGAGSGIGRALAVELAARGARLALSDVDDEGLRQTVRCCAAHGGQVHGYRLDVTDRAAVLEHAERVDADFGRADLVVNNAGVTLLASVADGSWEDLEWVMNVDFWGVVHGTRAFLPLLTTSRGHLVNISSVLGLAGAPMQSGYNAAKFAVRGFTEAVAQELRADGVPVGVSCVHPGRIRTNIMRNARNDGQRDYQAVQEQFERSVDISAEYAARAILRGVARNRARILIGADAYRTDILTRLLGPWYPRVVAGRGRRPVTSTGRRPR